MKRIELACFALGLLASGCSRKHPAEPAVAPGPADPVGVESAAAQERAGRVVLDISGGLDACSLGHKGVLLDFGDPSMRAALHPGSIDRSLERAEDESVEHEGASWLRVRSRVLTSTFYWPAVATDDPEGNAYVEARVRGILARTASVSIDGRPVGVWTLGKGETRIVIARASSPLTLSPGGHELTLHFVGGARATDEALAEIDWAHVGTGEPGDPYAAPTHGEVAIDATVGGRSMRSVSLRAPGFVHCSGWIPANATLEVSLATAGGGDADVEALLVRDRRSPIVLGTAHIEGDSAEWAPWSVPVTGLEGDGALASIRARGAPCWPEDPRAPRRRERRGRGLGSGRDDARGPQRDPRRAREHGGQDAGSVGRPPRGAGALGSGRRGHDLRGEPCLELARQRGGGLDADRAAGAGARPRRPRRALARRGGHGRRGVPPGWRRHRDVHGEPHDRRSLRLRSGMGHIRGARPARGRPGDAGLRRSGGLDGGAQGEPVLRGGACPRGPPAVGRRAGGF